MLHFAFEEEIFSKWDQTSLLFLVLILLTYSNSSGVSSACKSFNAKLWGRVGKGHSPHGDGSTSTPAPPLFGTNMKCNRPYVCNQIFFNWCELWTYCIPPYYGQCHSKFTDLNQVCLTQNFPYNIRPFYLNCTFVWQIYTVQHDSLYGFKLSFIITLAFNYHGKQLHCTKL